MAVPKRAHQPHVVPLDRRLCHVLVADLIHNVEKNIVDVRSVRFLSDHPWKSGKRLRSITFLLSTLTVRLDRGQSVQLDGRESRIATAVELFHEASLVHDDLVDRSQFRRGAPTVQMTTGDGMALLVGDYLLFRGLKFVLDAAVDAADIQLAREMADTGLNIAMGEAAQLDRYLRRFEDPERYSLTTYLDLIARKTAGFFAGCAEAGAGLAGAEPSLRVSFREFGMALGLAFQMVDDVIDVIGDEGIAQKTLRSNLSEGTVTLPMIHALDFHESSSALREVLTGGATREQEEVASRVLQSPEVIARCRASIDNQAAQASQQLARLPFNAYRLGLEDLLDYVRESSWGGLSVSQDLRPQTEDTGPHGRPDKPRRRPRLRAEKRGPDPPDP